MHSFSLPRTKRWQIDFEASLGDDHALLLVIVHSTVPTMHIVGYWTSSRLLLACAALILVAARCPNSCSGHGACGPSNICTCYPQWNGGAADCSQRVCPTGVAWADKAYAADYAHQPTECSNAGICNRETGTCQCFPGFTGNACQRSSCPSDCSGHGVCSTIGDVSFYKGPDYDSANYFAGDGLGPEYTNWDKNSIQLCECDPGFFGADCSLAMCPKGDDPLTINQNHRSILMRVASSGSYDLEGRLGLTFMGETVMLTMSDAYSAQCTQELAFHGPFGHVLCSVTQLDRLTFEFTITFYSWPTYPKLNNIYSHDGNPSKYDFYCDMTHVSGFTTCTFSDIEASNIQEYAYCSNRGLCNFQTGDCNCNEGFGGPACSNVTYLHHHGSNTLPGMQVNVNSLDYTSSALQINSMKSKATDFNMIEAIAGGEVVFYVRGDGTVSINKLLTLSGGQTVSGGGLFVENGGATIANKGLKVYSEETDQPVTQLSSTYAGPLGSAYSALRLKIATSTPSQARAIEILANGARRFAVRADGHVIVYNGGMLVTGGITLNNGGLQLTGGATVNTGGVRIVNGGLASTGGVTVYTNGLDVMLGGFEVYSGGASIYSGGLRVVGGHTITSGGFTVTGGVSIGTMGIQVTGGITIYTRGLTVKSQGATIESGGLIVTTDGLTVTAGGFRVSGGMSVYSGGARLTGGLTVVTGGAVVTTGGLTVTTGGLTVSGNGAYITGGLTVGDNGLVVALNGMTITSGGATITGGLTVQNNGLRVVQDGLTVAAGGLSVGAGGLTVVAGGLSITAGGLTVQAGGIRSTGGLTVHDTGLVVSNNGLTVSSGGATVANGLTVSTSGIYVGASGLTVNAGGLSVGADGLTVVAGGLSITAGGLTVQAGGIRATGGLTVANNGVVVTQDGLTVSSGGISAANGLTVSANGVVVTNGGLTVSNGGVSVANNGLTVVAGGLSITADGLTVSSGGLKVTGGAVVHDLGMVVTDGGLTVGADGMTVADGLTVGSGGLRVTNTGLTITAGGMNVIADGLTVTAGGLSVNNGGMQVKLNGAQVTGGFTVFNTGLRVDAGGLQVQAGGAIVYGGMTVYGNLQVQDTITTFTTSDRRLKRDIVPIDSALEKLGRLNGVYFKWIQDEPNGLQFDTHRHVGVLAQEVQSVLPEVVSNIYNGKYLGVDYASMVPLVIEAMHELEELFQEGKISAADRAKYTATLLDQLQKDVRAMESRLTSLETAFAELKQAWEDDRRKAEKQKQKQRKLWG